MIQLNVPHPLLKFCLPSVSGDEDTVIFITTIGGTDVDAGDAANLVLRIVRHDHVTDSTDSHFSHQLTSIWNEMNGF